MMFVPTRKHWNELSIWRRIGFVVLSITQVALLVAALRDIRRRPAATINGSKRWWTAAAFVNFVGPIAYFAFGRKHT